MAAYAPVLRVRLLVRTLVAIVIAVGVVVAPASPAAASDTGELISRANGARSSGGLASLSTHGELMSRAQEWAQRMANEGRIYHSNVGARVKAPWSKIAENVGVGGSAAQVHQAFMNSSSHRRNIMDPAFQYIGVGTAWRDGRIYVAQIFMRLQDGASSAAPAPSRVAPPRTVTPRAPRATRSAPRAPRVVAAPAPPPPPKPVVPVRISYSLDQLRTSQFVVPAPQDSPPRHVG